jgi:rubredoxin
MNKKFQCVQCENIYNNEMQYKGHLGAKKNIEAGCKFKAYPVRFDDKPLMSGGSPRRILQGNMRIIYSD